MISWETAISRYEEAALMIASPANSPALVTFTRDITVASKAFSPASLHCIPRVKATAR